MIVTFLGTSAANAFPEAFCKCRNCAQARMLGRPSLRKRSAALINDDLLIDLGPDIMAASHMHGCSLDNVQYCLQTHPQADHLDLSHLLSRSPDYGVIGAPVLNFYASRETLQRATQTLERDLADYQLLSPEAETEMRAEGVLGADSRVFATHIAHEGNPAHSDLTAFANQHGYEVAFDGLTLKV